MTWKKFLSGTLIGAFALGICPANIQTAEAMTQSESVERQQRMEDYEKERIKRDNQRESEMKERIVRRAERREEKKEQYEKERKNWEKQKEKERKEREKQKEKERKEREKQKEKERKEREKNYSRSDYRYGGHYNHPYNGDRYRRHTTSASKNLLDFLK